MLSFLIYLLIIMASTYLALFSPVGLSQQLNNWICSMKVVCDKIKGSFLRQKIIFLCYTNETKKKGSIVIPATNVISDEPGERISLRRP